jgi:flagellar motor switch protein FliG
MGNKNDIVVTACGHDKTIDAISVNLFEAPEKDYHNSRELDAETYCDKINSLELKGDSWVFAKILSENKQYSPDVFIPLNFSDLILELDGRDIQKVLREIDSQELIISLKDQNETEKEKIFTNISKRAAKMLKEDMEVMGPVRMGDVREAQKNILNVIRHLDETGEIAIPRYKGESIL